MRVADKAGAHRGRDRRHKLPAQADPAGWRAGGRNGRFCQVTISHPAVETGGFESDARSDPVVEMGGFASAT
jgi:hypothetical protein